MKRWAGALALTLGIATSAVACANSNDISATAAHNLRRYVEEVRQAASSGSYSQLQQAVAALQTQVQKEEASGDLSSSRANEILNAAGVLLTDARPTESPTPSPTIPPTTTTLTTTTTVPPTTTSIPSPTTDASPTVTPTPLVHVSAQSQSK